jgi:uncharacterized protein YdaU (DUF1376 family)
MSEPSPAFQFYPRDFLSDERVRIMDATARGVYITLLCVCWIEGSLPVEDRAIQRIGDCSAEDWARIRDDVLVCFTENDGRYRHGRLDRERQKQAEYAAKQAESGRLGARGRWRKDGKPMRSPKGRHSKPIATPMANNGSASAFSSSSSSSSSSASAEEKDTPQPPEGAAALPPEKSKVKIRNAGDFPLASAWNASTSSPLPKVNEVSPERARKIKTRLGERSLGQWEQVFRRIEASSFCRGNGSTGWVATFDWIVGGAEASVKVLEGKYDDRDGQAAPTRHVDTVEDLEAYIERKKIRGF